VVPRKKGDLYGKKKKRGGKGGGRRRSPDKKEWLLPIILNIFSYF